MAMHYAEARTAILDTWKDRPEGRVCVAALDALVQRDPPPEEMGIGTLRQFATEVGIGEADSDAIVLGALTFISGSWIHLVDVRFELRDTGGTVHPLAPEAVGAARRANALAHPVTGEPVQDWESRVYLGFPVSDFGRALRARTRLVPHGGCIPNGP